MTDIPNYRVGPPPSTPEGQVLFVRRELEKISITINQIIAKLKELETP